ncbi:transposase [Gammaproteobacteria bacterium]
MKTTRIALSKQLNPGKLSALEEQAQRLGAIRSEVWQRYGSIQALRLTDRQIRDTWINEKRTFPVLANAWKETLRDAETNIVMTVEAAKVKARQAIRNHSPDVQERKSLYARLKTNQFVEDRYLARVMRKYWNRGHNHTHNQIIVRSDSYTSFQLGGHAWIKIPGLERGQRIAIPLNTIVEPTGTLRLILREAKVEVHYAVEVTQTNDCGVQIIGVDKGYTEVLVDSDGEHHGKGLGELLSTESDALKSKNQRRAKLRAIAENTRNNRKRQHILKHNLGRKKKQRHARIIKAQIRDKVYQAVHAVVDKASVIVAEDLTAQMSGKNFGRNVNRRLANWTKGIIAEAIENVSQRRGSTLVLVNPAYTSQMDSRSGCLLGSRKGDQFHCFDGVVLQADENAARNVLARLHDPGIDRWTPFKKVKSILLERTERLRLRLSNQDSSCGPTNLSTESEISKNLDVQVCPGF